MKLRNIIALMLVFVLAFGLASCKKQQQQKETKVKENNFEKVSEVKIVDEKGEEHTLATQVNEDTGETEYFYEDNSGNVVTVKAKEADKGGKTEFYVVNNEGEEVTVEATVKEKVVTVPRTRRSEGLAKDAQGATASSSQDSSNPFGDVSLTPEQESFIASFSNKNPEDIADNNAANTKFKLGSSLLSNNIESSSSGSSKLTDDSEGAASRNQGQTFFDDIKNKNSYTIKFAMRNTADGQSTSIPVTIARSGSKRYLEASAPLELSDKTDGSMTMKAYLNGDEARVYIPNIKAYMDVPGEEFNEMLDDYKLIESNPDDSGYKGTSKTSYGGKSYIVDVYETSDGKTFYYYEGNNLRRIESTRKDNSSTILEITEISDTADSKLFVEPTGYLNISDIVGEEINK